MSTTTAQSMDALDRANRVRTARAILKQQIADGERTVAAIVLDVPWEAEAMPVAVLLIAQRQWGRARCRRFLAGLPMTESKPLGSLSDRQRRLFVERLGVSG